MITNIYMPFTIPSNTNFCLNFIQFNFYLLLSQIETISKPALQFIYNIQN